jgi:16S rRNA G966 N2-methylase RsmD
MKKLKEKITIFLDCFFVWKVKKNKKDEPEDAYIYFCPSFGDNSYPNSSNQVLALILEKYYLQKRVIIIIQKEIADYLSDVIVNFTISKHQKESKYLDTFKVCRQCFNYCQEINLKKILVFCSP